MRSNATLATLVLLLAAALPGQAEEAKDPCDDPQSSQQVRECTAREYKATDAELDAVYRELMARLDNADPAVRQAQKERLKAAERAWLAYRDAQAAFEVGFYEGGQMQGQMSTAVATGLTRRRIRELRSVLEEEKAWGTVTVR